MTRLLQKKRDSKAMSSYRRWHKKPEAYASNVLAQQLEGRREVPTPVGSIDVLTNSELIEVKKLKDWKSGLGQLIAYGTFFPDHLLRLHLIGEPDDSLKPNIQKACEKIGATFSYQEEVYYS